MANMPKKYVSLSKKMSLALRHNPKKFGLKPDNEGWVELTTFLKAMKMTEEDLEYIQANNSKKRFHVSRNMWGDHIRAHYGHSSVKIEHSPVEPPEKLYHGTTKKVLPLILETGIKPMGRQYAHHSTDISTAVMVGKRRDSDPPILEISAKKAHEDGKAKFYLGNEDVWMSGEIPPEYLKVLDKED